MDARGRRLKERVKAMIRDENQPSLDLFEKDHPITWKLILNRLKKDDDEKIRSVAERLSKSLTDR